MAAPAPAAAPALTQAPTQTIDTDIVAQATVATMQMSKEAKRRRQTKLRKELADAFLKRADVTVRRLAEVNGDPTYKRFSRTQKGKITGWCGVNTLDEVPKFWHNFEATELEDNLRTMVDRLWSWRWGALTRTYTQCTGLTRW